MRIFIVIIAAASALSAASAGHRTEHPKEGIQTPGIQIPFASLKAEEIFPMPEQPPWIFYSTAVYVPAMDHIDKIDVKTKKLSEAFENVHKPCGGMVAAFGSLWLPSCGDGSLIRLDAKTSKVTATVAGGAADVPGSLAATGDSVWMLTDSKTTLSRIDPDQNAIVGEIRVFASCRSLAYGEKALWLACPDENKVLRINPETNLLEREIPVAAQPEALTIGADSVWVLCGKDGKVDRIDPKNNQVSKSIDLGVPGAKGAILFGEGFVWVTVNGFPLTRIDPQSDTVAQQFYGAGGGGTIGLSPGAIWLANSGTLLRIDPKRVLATLAE